MAKKFRELEAKMSPEAISKSDAKYKKLKDEMGLSELRVALALTQETLAKNLEINQAAVSKIESRTDMFVSTLRNFIQAMGAELEIRAKFPDGHVVHIAQFSDLEEKKEELVEA